MEEDIFIVESFLKNKKMLLKHPCWVSEKTIQAIEKLINKYKEQKIDIQASHILLAKYSQKNEEQEKIIELMAKYIQSLISKYEDDTYTYTSIKEYFKKKASEENEQSR